MEGIAISTLIIIGLNVLVSFKGFKDRNFLNQYSFNIEGINRGEKIRYFTSAFLHVDTTHLFFNMFTLYFFADAVIHYLGEINFVLIYIGSLILGNIFSHYFHKDEPHYSAVGASGAVMGVLYSAILLNPEMSLYLMLIPIPIPAYVFGIGYLLYTIYGMRKSLGNVGHDAHFGGAMAGYIITLIMAPGVLEAHLNMVILLFIPIVVLFIVYKGNFLSKK